MVENDWNTDRVTDLVLNGVNSLMVDPITDRSPHEETKPQTHTFDLIKSIRARRSVCSASFACNGAERLVKSVVRHMIQTQTKEIF